MAELITIINQVDMGQITIKLALSILVLILTYILIKVSKRLLDKVINYQHHERGLINPEFVQIICSTIKAVVNYGGLFLAFLTILEIFDVSVFQTGDLKAVGFQLLRVIAIFIGARLIINFQRAFTTRWISKAEKENEKPVSPRMKTLGTLLNSILTYGIFFIAGLMILETFRINTTAILASVGVLGLAVGFGAQNLVKDIISGFFIIFEDQFRVGEFVEAGGATGVVEEIGLRTTKIKRWTGHLEILPNGEITKVVNYSRNNMLAICVVGIAYEMDLDKAQEVLRKISEKAYQEIDAIVEVPIVQGVVALADSSVNVRVIATTLPGEQWEIERELLGRFKKGLDEAGIEIPYPRRVIYQGKEK